MPGGVVHPLAAAEVLDCQGGDGLLEQVGILRDDAADRGHPGAGEMTGRQGTDERPFAFASRNSGEVLEERKNTERTVFFRGVRPVGVRIDDDDLVQARARTRKRGHQRLCRRVRKDVRFEDHCRGGARACERSQARAGIASDIERGDVLRRT